MPRASTIDVQQQHAPTGLVAVDGRSFPLESTAIRAQAEGGLALTVLTQEYRNPYQEPLEVGYTMPLPADGAVLGYTIHLGERVIRGEIERREKARADYIRALEEGRSAGLLEQQRADTFTQSLGNLPPGARVRVEIEVLQPLRFVVSGGERKDERKSEHENVPAADQDPEWEFRFPTVVGVRYEGEPGRVPDAEALDVDRADGTGTPVRLELDLVVADGAPGRAALRSPSHEVVCAQAENGGGTRVTLASPSRLDRDLVVRWAAAGGTVAARLTEGKGLAGDDGRYGVLTLTPPAAPRAAFARDLSILIDASGSMTGRPIEQAKSIAEALLLDLRAGDQFELLAFASDVIRLTPRAPFAAMFTAASAATAATPRAIEDAVRAVRALRAGGATEMVGAMVEALAPLREEAQRQVIVLTDGEIGFESEILRQVRDRLPAGSRLHMVGIGSAPNRTLMRGAARAGRGLELLVAPTDDAAAAARRLRSATAAPVLTGVVVEGSAVLGTAPAAPRDVFAGQPALVAVELRKEGGRIVIRGRLAGTSGEWTQTIEVPPLAEEEALGGAGTAKDGESAESAGAVRTLPGSGTPGEYAEFAGTRRSPCRGHRPGGGPPDRWSGRRQPARRGAGAVLSPAPRRTLRARAGRGRRVGARHGRRARRGVGDPSADRVARAAPPDRDPADQPRRDLHGPDRRSPRPASSRAPHGGAPRRRVGRGVGLVHESGFPGLPCRRPMRRSDVRAALRNIDSEGFIVGSSGHRVAT